MITIEEVMQAQKYLEAQAQEPFVLPVAPRGPAQQMELLQTDVDYDVQGLQNLVIGILADYLIFQEDPTHRTPLLKNTTQQQTMLLDGLEHNLPEYLHLRCVSVNKEEIAFVFKERLHEEEIHKLIAEEQLPFTKELRKYRGRNETRYLLDGKAVLGIQLGSVNIPYQDAGSHLKESVALATGLVARIHQERLLNGRGIRFDLDEYQPIFELLLPDGFSSQNMLTPFLMEVYEILQQKEIPQGFSLTNASAREGAEKQRYAYKREDLPDHLRYLVISPAKQEIYLRFGSHMDLDKKISSFLKMAGYSLGEEMKRKFEHGRRILKGGGSRFKMRIGYMKEREIHKTTGESGPLLSIEHDTTMKLSTAQPRETFALAAEIAGNIYHRRLFYTYWEATEQTDTDLTETERLVIGAVRPLQELHRFFIERLDARERIEEGNPPRNSLKWIADYLKESGAESFEGKILGVLKAMDKKLEGVDFSIYGREKDTQDKAQQLYGALQQLKGRFEALSQRL